MSKIIIKFIKHGKTKNKITEEMTLENCSTSGHYELSNYFNDCNPEFPSSDKWDEIQILKSKE